MPAIGRRSVSVTTLRLADFRNYPALKLGVSSRFVVLTGDNGAGKTNLLEALSLLSPGRGLRRATYGEIARAGGSGGFSIHAALGEGEELSEATIVARPNAEGGGPQRSLKLDGAAGQPMEALLEICRVLWLTPAMDGLFGGPAGDRRRFLDRLVLTLDPLHGRRSADYEKAMRGRNRLLAEDRREDAWLSGIERQMAELGLAIALARADTVRRLQALGDARPLAGEAFPAAELALFDGYEALDLCRPAADVEDEIAARLMRARGLDRSAGRTLEGPHRADLAVTHREKAMPAALASTGEQKALLVGLVLSHAELVGASSGLAPILLLDEIAAHLDRNRRAALFDIVDRLGVQAFMTGTDASLFEALAGRAQMLIVSGGTVSEAG